MLGGVATATAIIVVINKSSEPTTAQPAQPGSAEAPPVANTGLLTVQSVPRGAKITVDGQPLEDGGTLTVELGRHKIHAELIGYAPMDIEEEVIRGVKSSVTLPLQPLAIPTTTVKPPAPPPAKNPPPTQTKTPTTPGPKGPKTRPMSPQEMEALTKAALWNEVKDKLSPIERLCHRFSDHPECRPGRLGGELGYLATPMQELFEHGLNLMLGFSRLR